MELIGNIVRRTNNTINSFLIIYTHYTVKYA